MSLRAFTAVALAALMPLFFSCETLRDIVEEPRVSISSVGLAGISVDGVDMVAYLDVENPNLFAIPFPEVEWELFIDAASFVKGSLKSGANLGAGKTGLLEVPFSVSYSGLLNTFSSLITAGEAGYRIDLGLRFPLPLLREKTFAVDYSGTIPLPRIPKISVGSVKIGKIDLTGVEQNWEFVVENPNAFPIPFPEMSWDYEVGGVSLIRGSLVGKEPIAAGTSGITAATVRVLFADALKALGGLVSGTAETPAEAASLMKLDSLSPIPALQNMVQALEIPSTLPIFRKPELSFKGIMIRNLGLGRLDFVANWEIDNPNAFSLDIKDFNYNLQVNNSVWAEGVMASPPEIKAQTKTVIPLEITISAIPVIQEIVGIINRGSGVNFSSSGSFNVSGALPGLDGLDLPFDLSGLTRLSR